MYDLPSNSCLESAYKLSCEEYPYDKPSAEYLREIEQPIAEPLAAAVGKIGSKPTHQTEWQGKKLLVHPVLNFIKTHEKVGPPLS